MKKKRILVLLLLISITYNVRSQHVDINDLDSVIQKADRLIETNPRVFFKNVESFIVYSEGNIRFEKYYNGINKDSLYHLQSQTKSIVSLLLGIAVDKGFISGENEFVYKYFPEYIKPNDILKSRLTIKDILTMSAGYDWEEMVPFDDPKNDNINMYNSNDYLHYVLSKSVIIPSFTEFNYNSGCPMIIAGIIEKTTKLSLEKFAEKYLFKPLNIDKYFWLKDSTGFCHAGGGLYLKPIDMLKIGVMIMNSGKYDDQQVISENWINKATQSYLPTKFDISGYGYFFWVREMVIKDGLTAKVISMEGAGGQKLYIFPKYNLAVAFTERNYTTPQVSPLFINESVLPLLK